MNTECSQRRFEYCKKTDMKNDHRIRLTKTLLHNAMLDLLREKPFNKITVKQICETAQINRATFYLHYADAYALLEDIHDHIAGIIVSAVQSNTPKRTVREFRFGVSKAIAHNFDYFEYACGPFCANGFLERVMGMARAYSFDLWKKDYPTAKEEDLSVIYTYISNGGAAVIRSWVQNGMKESPEELDELLEKISKATLSALKE